MKKQYTVLWEATCHTISCFSWSDWFKHGFLPQLTPHKKTCCKKVELWLCWVVGSRSHRQPGDAQSWQTHWEHLVETGPENPDRTQGTQQWPEAWLYHSTDACSLSVHSLSVSTSDGGVFFLPLHCIVSALIFSEANNMLILAGFSTRINTEYTLMIVCMVSLYILHNFTFSSGC